MRGLWQAGLWAPIVVLAGPARAECLGSCASALGGALFAMLVYGVLGIVIFVMLVRAKWRRGGVKLLAVVAFAAVGVPLLSQGWNLWKVKAMEGREVAGPLPELDGKIVLMLTGTNAACYYDLCTLVLLDRGEAGTFVLPITALEGLDTGKPLALADLPLELWQPPAEGSSETRSRPLTEAERIEAAGKIDYLIVQPRPWNASAPEPAEAGLRLRADLEGLKSSERVNFALGPIEGGILDLVGMKIDLLDLWLEDRALALILAPYNTQDPGNAVAGNDALIAAFCSDPARTADYDCDYALR